jgi:hypothetical protein
MSIFLVSPLLIEPSFLLNDLPSERLKVTVPLVISPVACSVRDG